MAATGGLGIRHRRARAARTKAQMCLWLQPELLRSVRQTARERGVPASELIERCVRAGLEAGAARQLEESSLPLLAEVVHAALEDHDRRAEDRLARLLVRSIVAADTTRRLLFTYLARQWGADATRQVLDSARTASIDALRRHGWSAALRLDGEEAEA